MIDNLPWNNYHAVMSGVWVILVFALMAVIIILASRPGKSYQSRFSVGNPLPPPLPRWYKKLKVNENPFEESTHDANQESAQ